MKEYGVSTVDFMGLATISSNKVVQEKEIILNVTGANITELNLDCNNLSNDIK